MSLPGFNSDNIIVLDERIIIHYPVKARREYSFFSIYSGYIGCTFIKKWVRDVKLEDIYDWRKNHPKGKIPKGIQALRKHLMEHCPEIFLL